MVNISIDIPMCIYTQCSEKEEIVKRVFKEAKWKPLSYCGVELSTLLSYRIIMDKWLKHLRVLPIWFGLVAANQLLNYFSFSET